MLALLTAIGGGAAFAALEEGRSTADGIYWSLTTMTTVGYGDLSPETTGGRVLAVAVMLVGIGFVAVLTGAIAERFLAREVAQVEEREMDLDATILDQLRGLRLQLDELEVAIRARRSD